MMTTLSQGDHRVLTAAREVRRTRVDLAAAQAKAEAARTVADELERLERDAVFAVTEAEAELDSAIEGLPTPPAETQGGAS